MIKMNYNLDMALVSYIDLLRRERYFDAHEALEEAWHPLRLSKNELRHPIKGLINVAIAFEHIKRGKNDAFSKAKKVIKAYDRYRYLCTDNNLLNNISKEVDTLKRAKGL